MHFWKGRVMNKYKNEDLRDMFGISHETVRKYTIDFQEFLSEGANPDENKHRVYDESDLRVFAVIVSMKGSNHTDDDIRATLAAGQTGDLSSLLNDDTVALSPPMQAKLAKQEINNLRSQLELSVQEAQTWRDKANRLEGQIELLKAQLEQKQSGQADVIELHKEIARLTVLLEMAKGKHID